MGYMHWEPPLGFREKHLVPGLVQAFSRSPPDESPLGVAAKGDGQFPTKTPFNQPKKTYPQQTHQSPSGHGQKRTFSVLLLVVVFQENTPRPRLLPAPSHPPSRHPPSPPNPPQKQQQTNKKQTFERLSGSRHLMPQPACVAAASPRLFFCVSSDPQCHVRNFAETNLGLFSSEGARGLGG